MRKGIILAGGYGSRLYPLTNSITKHLLPIYDKPMIYYSMSVLLLAGIRNILIISNRRYIGLYKNLFKNYNKLGIKISFEIQNKPRGIAEAFIIGKKFIGNSKVALILGDNLFFGTTFQQILSKANLSNNNLIFTYDVSNPNQYGVLTRKKMVPFKIIEKPKKYLSNEVVTGLYFYNNKIIKIAKKLKPSKRGELEISDINQYFLEQKNLKIINLGRGFTWFDAGNPRSLLNASSFIKSMQDRHMFKIGSIEEICLNKKFITKDKFKKYLKTIPNCDYKNYLNNLE